ncbi:hypothetical protein VZH09_09260 [Synechococcus elongatus IITB7]|uniref:hypothetical protein n=1 Tax=Synechococcus elongatus TaxID=32046 RepID=UPI0030D2BBB5
MTSPLSDLDELVLKCRDQKAKEYIGEAVACYKAGAFRSAIVATWIAVVFDILEKLQELSLSGDAEAKKLVQYFEEAQSKNNVAELLKFEKAILSNCRDKLELISTIEFDALKRLQEDRNSCAHPSMKTYDEVFSPPAELARMHIRSAVEYLLQHPPAQGKYALNLLLSEVNSEYFPTDVAKAVIALERSPLKKARDSLTKNFILVLLERLINDTLQYKEIYRITSALKAVEVIHQMQYRSTLENKLSIILRKLDDEQLTRIPVLIGSIKGFWSYLEADLQQKIESYVENLPQEHLSDLETFLSVNELRNAAQRRLKKTTRTDISRYFLLTSTPEIREQIVYLYSDSKSYEEANSFAPTVIEYAPIYSKGQIQKIINSCSKNTQIKDSHTVNAVIEALRKNKNLTGSELDQMLLDSGLGKFTQSSMKNEILF